MSLASKVVTEWSNETGRVAVVEGPRGHESRRESCPHLQLWVLLQGTWTERSGGRSRSVSRAEVVAYAPKEPCVRIAEERFVGVSIQVFEPEVDDAPSELPRELHHAVWRLAALARAGQCPEDRLLELSSMQGGASSREPDWLVRAHSLVRSGAYVDLNSLAREVGISPNHLSAAFRSHYGIPLSNFIRRERVRRAFAKGQADWILAGFHDPSHFHRTCREEFGVRLRDLKRLLATES